MEVCRFEKLNFRERYKYCKKNSLLCNVWLFKLVDPLADGNCLPHYIITYTYRKYFGFLYMRCNTLFTQVLSSIVNGVACIFPTGFGRRRNCCSMQGIFVQGPSLSVVCIASGFIILVCNCFDILLSAVCDLKVQCSAPR